MEVTDISNFEKQWDKFLVKFRGKLLGEEKKQPLTHALVSIHLREARQCWESEFDESGRWLRAYQQAEPIKGERISQLLVTMKVSELPPVKTVPVWVELCVPVVGAAVGLGVACLLQANAFVKVISTIAPAGVLFVATGLVKRDQKSRAKDQRIDQYIEQLTAYKEEVLRIMAE